MNNTNHEHGIHRLILDRKGDRSMESLSRACGGNPTRANLQRMATEPTKSFPKDPDVIRGLAKGLGVRISDVVSAFAVSIGLPMDNADDDLTLAGAGRLPKHSQQVLRDTADNMLWWQEQSIIASDGANAPTADVHELFPAERIAADKGEKGVDPEQLPE